MEQNIIDFLTKNTGIKNEQDILSKYTEEYKNRTVSDDDGIIAHVAANIRNLNYNGKDYKSAFIIDSVVKEDMRRQGIYTKLYKELESDIKADILYAFPLQYELINLVDKQDYKIIGEVEAYAKVLNPQNVISNGFFAIMAKLINKITQIKTKNISYSGYEIKENISTSDVYDLYEKVKSQYGFMSKRTSDWINSRINNRINYKILGTYKDGIEGYIIYKVIERGDLKYFMIMDILYSSREALESMYDYLHEKAKRENVNLIGLWKNSKTSVLIADKRFQNAKSSFPVVVKTDVNDALNINNWFLQPIEGETYWWKKYCILSVAVIQVVQKHILCLCWERWKIK